MQYKVRKGSAIPLLILLRDWFQKRSYCEIGFIRSINDIVITVTMFMVANLGGRCEKRYGQIQKGARKFDL